MGTVRCADLYARDCQALVEHNIYGGKGTIHICSTKTRGPFMNHSYAYPPDKHNTFCHNIGHPFSRQNMCLHPTLIQKHPFACKDTRDTLATTYKAGSGTEWDVAIKLASSKEVRMKVLTSKYARKLQEGPNFYKQTCLVVSKSQSTCMQAFI